MKLSPAAFWSLSLAEWRALTARTVTAHLNRQDLAALAARYPDIPYG